jgi:hypothetical protein
MLLEAFLQIVNEWSSAFPQTRTTNRAIRQALGSLICLGRRTLTRIIWTTGREIWAWSSEYFLHSRCRWSPEEIFRPIVEGSLKFCRGKFVGVVLDDTTVKKTGPRIRQAFWSRDPMSPRFNVNLRLGIRFLQFAIVVPLHKTFKTAARTIPISFEEVSALKRPRKGRKDYDEKIKEYKELSKLHNLSKRALPSINRIRETLDSAGAVKKDLIIIGDGSFCNRTVLSYQIERTDLLLRIRKDAKLCKRSEAGRRFYSENKFTPHQILDDASVQWQKTKIFYGGKLRVVRYKEVPDIYWQSGAKRRPIRLLVVAPTPYRVRKTGKQKYRDPAFLLTTRLHGDTKALLQLYFDRWQIEVNHREEKDTLGIGQAQLHNFSAVPKQPALVVAAYSALLLASLIAFGPHRTDSFLPLPRWRANAKRPSCLDLVSLLRKEIVENQTIQNEMGIQVTYQRLATVAAA